MTSSTASHDGPGPAAARAKSQTRHLCHCGKGFLRKEHLRRHQATHQLPSFTCQICDRSFTRNDVLRRHLGVHSSLNAPLARGWSACDVCHESKTKCDGGRQCSLCTKRGIMCTYSRDQPRLPAGSAAAPTAPTGPVPRSSMTTSSPPPASLASSASSSSSSAAGLTPVVPSAAAPSVQQPPLAGPGAEPMSTRVGLGYLLGVIAASVSGRPESELNLPRTYGVWVESCLDTYFASFHERWPVVHGPVLRDDMDHVPLTVATLAMIGAWLQGGKALSDLILNAHGRLCSYALKQLMVEDVHDPGASKAWPHMAYEVALLNSMFAFETGRQDLLPRARRLLCLTISSLRDKGAFNHRQISRHAETHFPGTFRPWNDHQICKWKWLAVSALKIDVYLALVSNQPPIMHSEELQLGVPPTFALWNSWGLDKYFRRLQDEPADRSSFSMASMAQSPQTLIPSGALVEDVVTGLCGSYQNIWRLAQVQWSGGFVPQGDSDRAWLSQPLHAWKDRLEGIANLWADPVANAHAIRCLLLSYLGQETPDQPGWEQSVMNRITRFVLNGRMLYHLLLLHLNINVRFMTVLALGSWSIAGVGGGGPSACMPRDDVDLVQLSQWAVSHDARQAILHCLVVLMAYERDMVTVSGASGSVDPITHVTLATAAAIMRGWFLTNAVPCACLAMGAPPAQSMEIDTGAITENRGWVANGGCVTVDGVPICACSSETWMTRFASTLRRHGRGWNLAELVATRLQTSVHVAST